MINPNRKDDQHRHRVGRSAPRTALERVPKTQYGARPKRSTTRYEELKGVIVQYFEDRVKAGAALKEIRDNKLYKDEYSTFEEFCQHECGMSRSQAYRQMELPEINTSLNVPKVGTSFSNESQARALVSVPKERRVEVMQKVTTKGRVTAKRIREAAKPKVIDAEFAEVEPPSQRDEVDKAIREYVETHIPVKHPLHECPMCRCQS